MSMVKHDHCHITVVVEPGDMAGELPWASMGSLCSSFPIVCQTAPYLPGLAISFPPLPELEILLTA